MTEQQRITLECIDHLEMKNRSIGITDYDRIRRKRLIARLKNWLQKNGYQQFADYKTEKTDLHE